MLQRPLSPGVEMALPSTASRRLFWPRQARRCPATLRDSLARRAGARCARQNENPHGIQVIVFPGSADVPRPGRRCGSGSCPTAGPRTAGRRTPPASRRPAWAAGRGRPPVPPAARRSSRGCRWGRRPGWAPNAPARQTLPKAANRNWPSTESCGVTCRGVPRRTLLLGQGQRRCNARRNLLEPPGQVAALHAAHGADPLHVGRLPLGQLDDQVVAEHAPGGLVAVPGLGFAPLPQLADDRQAPRVEPRVARHPPPPLVGHRLRQLVAPRLPLLRQPPQAAEFAQPGVERSRTRLR